MIKVQQGRYLWVHLVGLAAVPLLLDICLAGLASAGPALPYRTQFWAIALLGIAPSLYMQLARPFYLFSLPPLALKPAVLSEDQRRCLTVLKSWQLKALAGMTAICLLWILVQLYERSPQVTPVMRPAAGLISAAVTFFLACTFLQIAVSAIRVILVGPDTLKRVAIFEEGAIASTFLIIGLRVNQILPAPPAVQPLAKAADIVPESDVAPESTETASEVNL
ncbi:MAG: low-complexity tail membrane protein [Phormidesmis sp.]